MINYRPYKLLSHTARTVVMIYMLAMTSQPSAAMELKISTNQLIMAGPVVGDELPKLRQLSQA
jgi:hypothetical protein